MKIVWIAAVLASACVDETNLGYSALETPATRWAVLIGGPSYSNSNYGQSVAIDSLGDVIAAGAIGSHGFVSKRVRSDGSERWSVFFAGSGTGTLSSVMSTTTDANDNVLVIGTFAGTVDFGGQTLSRRPAWSSLFLAKYAPDGHLVWIRTIEGTAATDGQHVLVDATGQIIVTGGFSDGTITLAGQTYSEPGNGFLLALDADGNDRWARVFQAPGLYLDSAANGDLLVSGQFDAPTSFGGAVISPPGRLGVYVARFRSDGLYLASRAFGVTNGSSGYGWVTTHPDGPIIVQSWDQGDDISAHGDAHLMFRTVDDDLDDLWSERIDGGLRLTSSSAGLVGVTMKASPYSADHPDQMDGHGEIVRFGADGAKELGTFGELLIGGLGGPSMRDAAAGSGAMAFIGEHGGVWDFGTGPLTGNGEVLLVSLDSPPE